MAETVHCQRCDMTWTTLDRVQSEANHLRVHHLKLSFPLQVYDGALQAPRPRILITGSREWDDRPVIERAILSACDDLGTANVVVVHGECVKGGADILADEIATSLGMKTEPIPADWSLGKKAGPLRNQAMVDLGADVCLAFPMPSSRGTFDCMARARAAGIPVINWGCPEPKH